MSWNNITPWWAIGNPFGPIPTDGKFYWLEEHGGHLKSVRHGGFATKAKAEEDMRAHGYTPSGDKHKRPQE